MFKHIITAVLTMTLAVSLFGAKEPVVGAKAPAAAVKAVKQEVKKACPKADAKDCKACPKAAAKECAKVVKADSNDMVTWYQDSTGKRYLVYTWAKPATVFACSFKVDANMSAGSELMTVAPEGRSKGKVKNSVGLRVVKMGANTYPAGILKQGDLIAEFMPIEMTHDSVDNAAPAMIKMPGWGEGFAGLWKSTGLNALIEQTTSCFKSTWVLGLGRVIMILVALVLIYLAIVKGFEPLLLLPIGFGALHANIPLADIANPGGLQWMIY